MPKIEIELSDIENIRDNAKYWQSKFNELDKEYSEFKKNVDVDKLAEKAKRFSIRLMNIYLKKIFNELGFDNGDYINSVEFDTTMFNNVHSLMESPITAKPCAKIIGEMKIAYLKIGFNPEFEKTEKKDPLEL